MGVSRVLETLPQEDLSVLEDGNAFLLTSWRVRRASNTSSRDPEAYSTWLGHYMARVTMIGLRTSSSTEGLFEGHL